MIEEPSEVTCCLKRQNYDASLLYSLAEHQSCNELVDCTLSCQGRSLKAHRVILSAASSYFKEIFLNHSGIYPMIFCNNAKYEHLQQIIEYIYVGEINVKETELEKFLELAENLKVRGLHDFKKETIEIDPIIKKKNLEDNSNIDNSNDKQINNDATLVQKIPDVNCTISKSNNDFRDKPKKTLLVKLNKTENKINKAPQPSVKICEVRNVCTKKFVGSDLEISLVNAGNVGDNSNCSDVAMSVISNEDLKSIESVPEKMVDETSPIIENPPVVENQNETLSDISSVKLPVLKKISDVPAPNSDSNGKVNVRTRKRRASALAPKTVPKTRSKTKLAKVIESLRKCKKCGNDLKLGAGEDVCLNSCDGNVGDSESGNVKLIQDLLGKHGNSSTDCKPLDVVQSSSPINQKKVGSHGRRKQLKTFKRGNQESQALPLAVLKKQLASVNELPLKILSTEEINNQVYRQSYIESLKNPSNRDTNLRKNTIPPDHTYNKDPEEAKFSSLVNSKYRGFSVFVTKWKRKLEIEHPGEDEKTIIKRLITTWSHMSDESKEEFAIF